MGAMAKTLEILRLNPDDALGIATSAFCLHSVRAWDPKTGPTAKGDALPHTFEGSSATDLVVHLPQPVKPGEVVGVDLEFTLRLDPKQGRWGQWKQVVYLMQWLPVPALFDSATGWNPVPFLPWHQPFANDSGHYTARITLPEGWNLATSGTQQGEAPDPGEPGWKRVMVEAQAMRDFSLAASPGFRFLETTAERGEGLPPVKVRVAVLAGHEAQGERIMRHAVTAISTYSRWLGAYPWPEFTLVESFFGWNGNEAGSMVFLDQRVFNHPELADGFVEYLVIHETMSLFSMRALLPPSATSCSTPSMVATITCSITRPDLGGCPTFPAPLTEPKAGAPWLLRVMMGRCSNQWNNMATSPSFSAWPTTSLAKSST